MDTDLENYFWKHDVDIYYRYQKLMKNPACSQTFYEYCVRRLKEIQEKYPNVKFD